MKIVKASQAFLFILSQMTSISEHLKLKGNTFYRDKSKYFLMQHVISLWNPLLIGIIEAQS